MTTFDEREKAFEHKFAHDMELQFKARARKNKMLGLRAAGLMGKAGADAETYARDIVMADFEKPGEFSQVTGYRGPYELTADDRADTCGCCPEHKESKRWSLLQAIEETKNNGSRQLVWSSERMPAC